MKTSLRIAASIAILMAAGQIFAKARDVAAKSARHANADAAKEKRATAKEALSGKANNKTDARQTRQERRIEEVKPLRHRYSFDADASDSVGNADLSLQGGASVSGGELVLPGGAYNAGHVAATGAALDEIAATINGAKGVTFESWVKLDLVDWARLFCIGSDGQNNMELVPRHDVNGVVQHPMARLNCPDATLDRRLWIRPGGT